MRLRSKLLLINAVVAGLAGALFWLTYGSARTVGEEYLRISRQTLPTLRAVEDVRAAALGVVNATQELMLVASLVAARPGDEQLGHRRTVAEALLRWAVLGYANAMATRYELVRDRASGEDRAVAPYLAGRSDAFLEASETFLACLEAGGGEAELLAAAEQLEAKKKQLLDGVAEVLAHEDRQLAEHDGRTAAAIASSGRLSMLGGLATLLLLAAAGWITGSLITAPIGRLTAATARIAQGELVPIAAHRSRDEIGALVVAFRRMVEDLAGLQSRLRDFAEASSDWLWEADADLRLVHVSGRFAESSGIAADNAIGRPLTDLLVPEDTEAEQALRAAVAERRPFRNLACRHRRIGTDAGRAYRLAGRPVRDPGGRLVGYRGTATDITAEVEARARAEHLALHDALTDLPNRTLLADRLEQSVSTVRRRGGLAAVLCLDLDHFKEVNDTLGHGAGDQLLKEVADFLRASVRETDTVARLGGDEFAVVLNGLERPSGAEELCRRLLARFAEPVRLREHEVFVGLSIGVALVPDDGGTPEALLKSADIALYRAKAEGRGTFRFFALGMNAALQARKALEDDLRRALAKGELEVHYQPLVDVGSGRMTGVEALTRWPHRGRGWISPAEFIPIAETTGLILPLGEWVLRTACAQVARWPGLTLSVNLSPVQFRHPDLVGLVRRTLAETGLAAERLELEITEGVLLQDTEAALATLQGLKDLGVRVSMDDFGTGYSSLSYLHRFPFDKIKIDQSFVRILERDPSAAAIVRAVLGLGRSLGMQTTAEGVETPEQLGFLQAEGCHQVQGYHLGRPQPAEAIERLLRPSAPSSGGLPSSGARAAVAVPA